MKPTKQDPRIKQLDSLVNSARSNLKAAGDLLVEMLDENPNVFEEILAACRSFTLAMLEALERIGRGIDHPLLLADPSAAAQRAIRQSLNYKDQERLLTGLVPCAVRNGVGIKIEQRRAAELNARQACLVIGDGKIRTPDEQIEMLKREEAASAARRTGRWRVDDDGIFVYHDTKLDWSTLIDLVQGHEAHSLKSLESSMKANQV